MSAHICLRFAVTLGILSNLAVAQDAMPLKAYYLAGESSAELTGTISVSSTDPTIQSGTRNITFADLVPLPSLARAGWRTGAGPKNRRPSPAPHFPSPLD